jgi:hypothetical protein
MCFTILGQYVLHLEPCYPATKVRQPSIGHVFVLFCFGKPALIIFFLNRFFFAFCILYV